MPDIDRNSLHFKTLEEPGEVHLCPAMRNFGGQGGPVLRSPIF